MRGLGTLACLSLSACVTESLSICVNCGGLSITDMRGGFAVVLTAHSGAALPCADLTVRMESPITWDGCLSPRGGTADSIRGIIRLAFADSTGAASALEFFDFRGDADSIDAAWRSACKLAPSGSDCPSGEGTAEWSRPTTAGTAALVSGPRRRP